MPRLVATVVDPGWPTHHVHDLGFDGHVNADMSAPAYEHLRTLRALTEAAVTKGSRPPRDCTMLIDYPTLDEVTGADETNRKILALLSIGREDREIASAVCLSAQTVRNRMSAMLRTSGMANRTQLAVFFVHRMAQQESSGTAEYAMAIHTIYRAS
jgi:DNA-binding CsgD family transcriptional regulator